jgi:hypothetical protein
MKGLHIKCDNYPTEEIRMFASDVDPDRTKMVVLEGAYIYMIGDAGEQWLMRLWHTKPEIGWVTFGMHGTEKSEKFAVAYVTDITNVHGSRLPKCVPEQRVSDGKGFAIDVTVGHCRLGGKHGVSELIRALISDGPGSAVDCKVPRMSA